MDFSFYQQEVSPGPARGKRGFRAASREKSECASPEHTDFSLLATRKLLLLPAVPGDVVLLPRLIWIWKQRGLRAPARDLSTGT